MSSAISLSLKVNVTGGPSLLVSKGITVEAYDKIDVLVAAGAADMAVDIQPGLSSQVQLLCITSSEYGKDLKYKVHDTASTPIVLDQAQLFLGQGAVGLLGTAIDKLFFTNNLTKDASIEILVGRDATP
jgi:hypothetical protein